LYYYLKAKSGAESIHMPDQSHILEERVLSKKYCDMDNEWKVVTFFVGVSFHFILFHSRIK
jgi:hypothetical protein